MFQVYFESIKDLVMKCASSMLWTYFWNTLVIFSDFRSIYTWSILSILMYLFLNNFKIKAFMYLSSNSEVYWKQTFSINFFLKLWSTFEVDFLNLCMFKFRSLFEADFLNNEFLFRLRNILEVYFISKKVKMCKWSIIEV